MKKSTKSYNKNKVLTKFKGSKIPSIYHFSIFLIGLLFIIIGVIGLQGYNIFISEAFIEEYLTKNSKKAFKVILETLIIIGQTFIVGSIFAWVIELPNMIESFKKKVINIW